MLSPFLFVAVVKALICEIRRGLPLVAGGVDSLKEKILRWKEYLEVKLRLNIRKMKVIVSGRSLDEAEPIGRWLCAICL